MTLNVKKIISVGALGFILLSCKKNPVDKLSNPNPDGLTPQLQGSFPIFYDELKGGPGSGYLLAPSGENQTIDEKDTSSPRRSICQFHYTWNGGDVPNNGIQQHLFAGVSFSITPSNLTFVAAKAKNLSAGAYTKLKFLIRGSLSSDTVLKIEGPNDGDGGITPAFIISGTDFTLSTDWQELTLTVPSSDFNAVKTYITCTFIYTQPPRSTTPGGGGEIYLDDIRYEP